MDKNGYEGPGSNIDDIFAFAKKVKEAIKCKCFPRIHYKNLKNYKYVDKSDQSFKNQFDQAELIRKELIDSKKFGPEFSEKLHPKAIYTSRSLNSYISKCSSIFSKCSSINFTSNDYISEELKLDIDIESSGLNSTWN
ncbi:498_t:CDS:2 [Rhizophagus irregularis]|nr:498_t:CDS:2 [Rhizophagus irregularis]